MKNSNFYFGLGNASELLSWFSVGLLGSFIAQAFSYYAIGIYVAAIAGILIYLIVTIGNEPQFNLLKISALVASLIFGFWEFFYVYKFQMAFISFLLLALLGVVLWSMMDKILEMIQGVGQWLVQMFHGSNSGTNQ